jgi:hypothetical protein
MRTNFVVTLQYSQPLAKRYHTSLGLARTIYIVYVIYYIYDIRCIYGIFGRKITKYTVT